MRESKTRLAGNNDNRRSEREAPGGMSPPRRPREYLKPLRFSHYTPITTRRSQILEEALNVDLILPHKRTPTPPNADQNRYCQYHRNFDHTTEECVTLKDKIEELIQAGHLKQFVSKQREERFPRTDTRQGLRNTQRGYRPRSRTPN